MKYESTSAYKLGIIDKKGKALKRSADLESTKEKASYTMLHRMVFKMRKILEKTPAGRFVNYAAALFLLKEQKDARIWTDDGYMKSKLLEFLETDWKTDAKFLKEEVDNMDKKSFKSFLSEKKNIKESQELQAMMALDDAGIEAVINKKGQIVVKKKDIKKAEKALSKSFRRGGEPDLYHEEVEIDEAINLKKLRKEYDKNEDQNYHTENYLLLAKAFGTSAEVKKVEEILKRNKKQGTTSKKDSDWMYKNINKYVIKKAMKRLGIKEEVELDEAETPMYPPTIKNLRMIVKDKQNQVFMFKVGKARVDTFTASAIIAVYDGLKKPEHKKKLEDMIKTKEGFLKTQAFAMKMVK
jgi:hypothetical protein